MPAYVEDPQAVRLLAELEPIVEARSTATSRWRRSGSRTSTSRGRDGRNFDGPLGGDPWEPERLPAVPTWCGRR